MVSIKNHQGRNRNNGGMEEKMNGKYLRLIPGLCLEDRMIRYASDVISIGGINHADLEALHPIDFQ